MNSKRPENLWLFDENRLLVLKELYTCKNNLCGCDITDELDLSKNLLSYHIRVLREEGLIKETKCGRKKEYVIKEDKLGFVKRVLTLVELI